MQVKAKFIDSSFGYYNNQRKRDGDVFTLSEEGHFSEEWMVKLEEDKPKRSRKPVESQDGAL